MSAPSFRGLRAASPHASKAKQRNGAKNTGPELLLRSHLHRLGLRFRLVTASVPGRPDIVFPGPHVAVFCDGDFWHGRNWEELRTKLLPGRNSDYWASKIAYNIERDLRVTSAATAAGWHVLRFRESDIRRDPDQVAGFVKAAIDTASDR